MKIIPYIEQNGMRSIPDNVMVGIYDRMKKLGLVEVVFFAGDVDTHEKFLAAMKNPNNIVNVVIKDKIIVALFWLTHVYYNSAFGHFCMFPEIWGRQTIKCLRNNIDYWFGFEKDNEPILDVIIGKMPTTNRKAIKFIEKCGFTMVGDIPLIAHGGDKSKRVGDTIMYITRGERLWAL